MARIIYDNEQPSYYDSGSLNNPRYNGGFFLLLVVILLLLFFWTDLPRLRNNLDYWLSGNSNSAILPVKDSVTGNNTEIRYVTADNLNLREQPSELARATYQLPRGTKVALLGNSHQEPDGDVWLKVKAESFVGMQVGWVRQLWLGRNPYTAITPPLRRSIRRPTPEIRYITADNLDLRNEPSNGARASYSLPKGTKVTLLGNTEQDFDGEIWFQVQIATFDGTSIGWVNQRYFE
jgi:uncharacterized protein YgiM (DUF1202 family)